MVVTHPSSLNWLQSLNVAKILYSDVSGKTVRTITRYTRHNVSEGHCTLVMNLSVLYICGICLIWCLANRFNITINPLFIASTCNWHELHITILVDIATTVEEISVGVNCTRGYNKRV